MRPTGSRAQLAWAAIACTLLSACSSADDERISHTVDPDAAGAASTAEAGEQSAAGSDAAAQGQEAADGAPQMLDCLGQGSTERPASLTLDCHDSNATLNQLQWSRWSADGAAGTGEFSINSCQPDCAEGTVESYPVEVEAPEVKVTDAGSIFTAIVVTFPEGRPVGSTSRETYELPH